MPDIQIFIQCKDFCTLCRCLHGLINYVETKAKCHYLKEFIKETLRHVFICLGPQKPLPLLLTHCIRVYSIPPHPCTLYTCIMYTSSHMERGGGESKKVGSMEEDGAVGHIGFLPCVACYLPAQDSNLQHGILVGTRTRRQRTQSIFYVF